MQAKDGPSSSLRCPSSQPASSGLTLSPTYRAILLAFYLLIALHAFQLTLLANAEIQEILPLILQGFLVSLWWDRA